MDVNQNPNPNANQRKKSLKVTIAKSISNIFSRHPESDKSDRVDSNVLKTPTKEVKELNFDRNDETSQTTTTSASTTTATTPTTTMRKRLGSLNESDSIDEKLIREKLKDARRPSGVESPSFYEMNPSITSFSTTTSPRFNPNDIDFENLLKNIITNATNNNESTPSLPVLVDSDYNDYIVEGYVQMNRFHMNKDEDAFNYEDILEEDITETSREYSYYLKHFYKKEHFNFVGKYVELSNYKSNLFVLSVKHVSECKFTAILRTKDGNFYEEIDLKEKDDTFDVNRANVNILMRKFNENMIIREISPVICPIVSDELASYDKALLKPTFTFGIIYQKYAQVTEKEIFTNTENSKDFEEFLDFIGQRVRLKNFKKFRGGLDVINDDTGEESIYQYHDNSEIMFHVSTFLPHSEKDQQYVERKRHIGNDRVAIVFQDQDTIFSPKIIKSKLLHVFMIIQPFKVEGETRGYKVSVIQKKDVPYFGPIVRPPYLFNKDENLRKFLLSKLINAEYASLKAPAFSVYSEKTLEQSMQRLYETLTISTHRFIYQPYINYSTMSVSDSNNTSSMSSHLMSDSASQMSSSQSSNTSKNTVKSALRKLSAHYLKPENNPYIPESRLNHRGENSSDKKAAAAAAKAASKNRKTSRGDIYNLNNGANAEQTSASSNPIVKTKSDSNDEASDSNNDAKGKVTQKFLNVPGGLLLKNNQKTNSNSNDSNKNNSSDNLEKSSSGESIRDYSKDLSYKSDDDENEKRFFPSLKDDPDVLNKESAGDSDSSKSEPQTTVIKITNSKVTEHASKNSTQRTSERDSLENFSNSDSKSDVDTEIESDETKPN